jgi:hypothetical protein
LKIGLKASHTLSAHDFSQKIKLSNDALPKLKPRDFAHDLRPN